MKFFEKNKELIGMILIVYIASIYSFHSRIKITESDLKTITGILAEKPIESYHGGDMPRYFIRFRLLKDNHTYYLRNCSYDIINKTKVLNLEKGDHVVIKVKTKEIAKERKLNVYTFSSSGNLNALDLNSYNLCNTNSWRRFRPIIAIMLVVLLYRFMAHIGLMKMILNVIKKTK